jgi:hypothetical protein
MKGGIKQLLIVASAAIASAGAVMFFVCYGLGRHDLALGVLLGAGIALIEFDSTALLLLPMLKAGSKLIWGVLLAGKSLTVYAWVAVAILVLKVSGIGFMIGFSGLFLGIISAGALATLRQKGEG